MNSKDIQRYSSYAVITTQDGRECLVWFDSDDEQTKISLGGDEANNVEVVAVYRDGGTTVYNFSIGAGSNESKHWLTVPQRQLDGNESYTKQPDLDGQSCVLDAWCQGAVSWTSAEATA